MVFREMLDLIQGGTASFRDYETALVNAASNALDEREASKLTGQLPFLRLIQREHRDKVVLIFYRDTQKLPLLERDGDQRIFAATMSVEGGKPINASVFTYDGRLYRLEFSEDPQVMSGKTVTIRPDRAPPRSIVPQIDAEEHNPGSNGA
jgi:hypothetical protein